MAQLVKNPPAMWETWVWSLGWEDPLEKGKATHSILAWRIPWTKSMGSKRVRQDWANFTHLKIENYINFETKSREAKRMFLRLCSSLCLSCWRRKWQPTPVFLPRESCEQRSLVGCYLWGHTESNTNEAAAVACLFCSVQFSSVTHSCATLCNPMNGSKPGLPVHHQLPDSNQTHIHWVGVTIQSSHPLSYTSPPALNLSQHHGLFQWVSFSHQVIKDWSFSFNISPSNEYPGLIFFRMDWLDLLAVQGTLKNLLQHHSSKASILQCSAFFIVQLSL